MRGDSLRDLYAKTLAIAGLALIAGAGAVVDYWPVAAPVPTVGSPALPAPELRALTTRYDVFIPAPRPRPPIVVRGTIYAKNVGTARFLAPAPMLVSTVASATPAPPPIPDMAVMPMDSAVLALLTTPSPQLSLNVAPASAAGTSHQSGFIGGAIRKTRDSLVKAGAVTGSTLADGWRGVVGAFKKVTPF